jgi:hypothetical protein
MREVGGSVLLLLVANSLVLAALLLCAILIGAL